MEHVLQKLSLLFLVGWVMMLFRGRIKPTKTTVHTTAVQQLRCMICMMCISFVWKDEMVCESN